MRRRRCCCCCFCCWWLCLVWFFFSFFLIIFIRFVPVWSLISVFVGNSLIWMSDLFFLLNIQCLSSTFIQHCMHFSCFFFILSISISFRLRHRSHLYCCYDLHSSLTFVSICFIVSSVNVFILLLLSLFFRLSCSHRLILAFIVHPYFWSRRVRTKKSKKTRRREKKNKKYWKIPTEREYNTFRIQLYMEWWINLFRTSFFDSPWHSNYHSAKLNVGFQSPVKSRWGTYTHTFHIWFVYVKSMTYKGRQINEIFLWLDNFPANLATLVFTYCILYNWSSLVNIVHWWRWTLWDEAENLIYVMPRGVRTASCIHL